MPATTAIAEMALVSDISGVCSSGDTRRMTSSPRNVDRRKTNSFDSMPVIGRGRRSEVGGWGTLKHAEAADATGRSQTRREENQRPCDVAKRVAHSKP